MRNLNDILGQLERENGYAYYGGEKYVLLQQAYIDNDGSGESGPDHDYYSATAVKADCHPDEDDCVDLYHITWEILPSTWDYWEDGGDDEGDACDWENAESVRFCGEYDLSRGYAV